MKTVGNPDLLNHNAPLDAALAAKGCSRVNERGRSFFVDATGKYAPFPVGYITGPTKTDRDGVPMLYASVQGVHGWMQKTGEIYEEKELIKWALETARSL